jgi:putative oxidoreductase
MSSQSSHVGLSGAGRLALSSSDVLLLIARILLGFIFVRSGWGKVMDLGAFAAGMPGRGVPLWLGYVAGPVEFLGGIALIFGFATRYAAMLMLLFVIVATLTSHRYWEFTDATQRRLQDVNFYKNVCIMGGLIALFVSGGARLSIDGLLSRK